MQLNPLKLPPYRPKAPIARHCEGSDPSILAFFSAKKQHSAFVYIGISDYGTDNWYIEIAGPLPGRSITVSSSPGTVCGT